MNELKIFENSEFGQIRTMMFNNEPMFCLSDVCRILEIGNASQLKTRLKQDGVITNEVGVQTGTKADGTPIRQIVTMNFINESNLYKTIFQSRKESAERFTDWVTSEVLPQIRKTGSYQKPMTALEQINLTQQAVLEVNEKIENVKDELEQFKQDMPVLGCDIDRIQYAKNKKVVPLLGGKDSEAYNDKSIRSRVYSDISVEIRRQFQVPNQKCLKRNQVEQAIEVIDNYVLPIALKEEIDSVNSQMSFC